jgi:hypothetical protein
VGGYVEGASEGREGREDIDDQHRAIEGHDDSGDTDSDATNAGHQDQYVFSASRSATGVTNGASTADGTMRTSPTSPTADAPPSRYATMPSATVKAHSAVQAAK